MQAAGGQRTWTAMIYLNDVEEGGATWFPQAGIKRRAQTRAAAGLEQHERPTAAPTTLRCTRACRWSRATKYIVTKWFRERPWIKSTRDVQAVIPGSSRIQGQRRRRTEPYPGTSPAMTARGA